MNTIQIISIFVSGFAFGLILFILLEKIIVPDVDYEDEDFYTIQEKKIKPPASRMSDLRISPKQNFIGEKLGFTISDRFNKEASTQNNLKTKIIELKNRNKVAL